LTNPGIIELAKPANKKSFYPWPDGSATG